MNIADWVQAGRYVAALDAIGSDEEFARVDTAPRATRGNGVISVTDWVQAGRYGIGVDPVTPADVGELAVASTESDTKVGEGAVGRVLRVEGNNLKAGQETEVDIVLESLGDENALGFSLEFDPATLTFSSAALGSAAAGATLNVNTNDSAAGGLGMVLALPYRTTFSAGTQQVAVLSFHANAGTNTQTVLAFGDTPVWREVSDPMANPLSVTYADATLSIAPLPKLRIELVGDSVRISWPSGDGDFALQRTESLSEPDWMSVSESVETNGSAVYVTVPITNSQTLYRLKKD